MEEEIMKAVVKTYLGMLPKERRKKILKLAYKRLWLQMVFFKISKHKRIFNILIFPCIPFLSIYSFASAVSLRKKAVKYLNRAILNYKKLQAVYQNLNLINPEVEEKKEDTNTPVV